MGDMADDLLDREEYWDWDGDEEYFERPVTYKTCPICGEEGLVWYGKVKGKWVLGTVDGRRHFCPEIHTIVGKDGHETSI